MGKYLGFIEVKSSFYNFRPIAEITDSEINILTDNDRDRLLPKSALSNINFYYRFTDSEESEECSQNFRDKRLMVFEFDVSDLEENYTNDGRLNQTGYKIYYKKVLGTKLRSINSESRYRFITSDKIKSSFYSERFVIIAPGDYILGEEIFVQLDNKCYAGPYRVGYREYDNAYLITPRIKDNNYVLSVYKPQDIVIEEAFLARDTYDLYNDNKVVDQIVRVKKNAIKEEIDVITDDQLIDYFKQSIASEKIQNGKLSVDDFDDAIRDYDASLSKVNSTTHANRLKRIKDMLLAQKGNYEMLTDVSEELAKLFVSNADSPEVEAILQKIFADNPEVLDGLESTKIIQSRRQRLEEEIKSLEDSKDVLNQEIDEAKQSLDYEQRRAEELRAKDIELFEKMAELDALIKKKNLVDDIVNLEAKKEELETDAAKLQLQKNEISKEVSSVEARFIERMESAHSRMYDIAFDGFLSNEMMKAASAWEKDNEENRFDSLVRAINNGDIPKMNSDSLSHYVFEAIKVSRPQYSYNTVMNIMICLSQSLLTVFSGEPGCGKTSICKMVGRVLGLNSMNSVVEDSDYSPEDVNRFIALSVERGWTSKRDFIGYYNPLTKKFDLSNKRMYEALRILDKEKSCGYRNYPYMILLDEANLSPMEYYWADFMNICDDLDENSSINLGENYEFRIPETLRFVATMNSDHTTETLSPRLVDRAWVITLPKASMDLMTTQKISADLLHVVSWDDLVKTFGVKSKCDPFTTDVQEIYDSVLDFAKRLHINISGRANLAIRNYWNRASELMHGDDDISSGTVAIDYAIAQKVLPKLQGSGEDYENSLSEFKSYCDEHGLLMSARLLTEIIERGNQQMKYYQFF